MSLNRLKDKKVAILGLAVEGVAITEFLQGKVASLTILDQFSSEELIAKADAQIRDKVKKIMGDPLIDKVLGSSYMDNLSDFDIIFRTPGISYYNPAIQSAKDNGSEISSQIKLFFELCPATIIGVTGTKGKGTTASLIYEILKTDAENGRNAYIAGNIGYPAITLLNDLKPVDLVVLELSSFQLMDLDRSPHIAVVTNLAEEHLNYHGDLEEYQKSKFNLLVYQQEADVAILNLASTFREEWLKQTKSEIKYFSGNGDCDTAAMVRVTENGQLETILDPRGRRISICQQSEIKLVGKHNLENIAAAAIVCDGLGLSIDNIKKVVRQFTGLPHRLELVAEVGGVKYIDDSFGTTPGPTIAAIRAFPEEKILILGGSSKGADFSELAEVVAGSNVTGVVLIGDEAGRIQLALKKAGYEGNSVFGGQTMEEIVNAARRFARKKCLVILSPACASFGLFKNYKDRGDKFKAAVLNLTSDQIY